MGTTLTIRTDEALRAALEDRARARGITVSQAAREILRDALEVRPLEAKTSHLRGVLDLDHAHDDPWRTELRARNWRG